MSDLDPTPHSLTLEDPTVTRLLTRRPTDDRCSTLLESGSQVATSMSVVIPIGGTAAQPLVAAMDGWTPARLRVELLVMEDDRDEGRPALREQLSHSGRSWRILERPPGGRAAALAAGAVAAEHEFVLVGTGGSPPYGRVTRALSVMWAEGGDAALVEATDGGVANTSTNTARVDAAEALTSWLGLRGESVPGRLVVLRRWVARWLFNELTRALVPADEVADRARLLGIGIVHLGPECLPDADRPDRPAAT